MGYIRTYRYLIQHESDFVIAQQDHLRLVPLDVKWTEFCRFISTFGHIKDVDVSGRYSYGELRLLRLNFYAPFLLGKFHFEQIHGQYGDYFARLYGPILRLLVLLNVDDGPQNNPIVRHFGTLKSLDSFFGIMNPLNLKPEDPHHVVKFLSIFRS
jgi:hypothetical protein